MQVEKKQKKDNHNSGSNGNGAGRQHCSNRVHPMNEPPLYVGLMGTWEYNDASGNPNHRYYRIVITYISSFIFLFAPSFHDRAKTAFFPLYVNYNGNKRNGMNP